MAGEVVSGVVVGIGVGIMVWVGVVVAVWVWVGVWVEVEVAVWVWVAVRVAVVVDKLINEIIIDMLDILVHTVFNAEESGLQTN